MFKKTITYEDFNGNSVTKEFYFHLSKAELIAMAAGAEDMQSRIKRIVDAKDGRGIIKEFRDLLRESCGIRSEDGQRFIKTPETQSEFLDSPAFDELLMELCTDAKKGAEFVNNLLPEKMKKEMLEQLKKAEGQEVPNPFGEPTEHETSAKDDRPAWIRENRKPTKAELMNMPRGELLEAFLKYPGLSSE